MAALARGLALLLALGQAPALAATITVSTNVPDIAADGNCSLIEAIENANADNAGTHTDCAFGSVADAIVLPPNSTHTLTAVNNTSFGPTGLPVINSTITIVGNGSTITRETLAPDFRILAVRSGGDLTLQETRVSGGRATGSSFDPQRGGPAQQRQVAW